MAPSSRDRSVGHASHVLQERCLHAPHERAHAAGPGQRMERAKSISARVRACGRCRRGPDHFDPDRCDRRVDLLHDDRVALVARGVGGSLHEDAVAETAPDEGAHGLVAGGAMADARGQTARCEERQRVLARGRRVEQDEVARRRGLRGGRPVRRRAGRPRRAARGRAARTAARGGDCPGSGCRRRTRHPRRPRPCDPPAHRGSPRRSAGRRAGGRRRSRAAAAAGSWGRGWDSSRS